MAFTLRLEEKHEEILVELCSSLSLSTKNKTVLYLVENFIPTANERDKYFQELNKVKRELKELKLLLRNKREAEEKLNNILQAE